jgi:hypothetical protein
MCMCPVSLVVTCRTIIQFKAMYDDRKRDLVREGSNPGCTILLRNVMLLKQSKAQACQHAMLQYS